jgi:hypothetical protein
MLKKIGASAQGNFTKALKLLNENGFNIAAFEECMVLYNGFEPPF